MKPSLTAAALCWVAFPLAAFAAGPTTNPVELERAAFDRLAALIEPDWLDDVATIPIDARVRAYLGERREILDALADAAKRPQATWPAADAKPDPARQSLNGYRHATNILRLRARAHAADGEATAAVDDLMTAIALGRHVGQQKILIGRLVEIGIEIAAIDTLATLLPGFPKDVLNGLPARLDALPASPTLAETIDAEQAFGRAMMAERTATKPPAGEEAGHAAGVETMKRMAAELPAFYAAMKAAAPLPPAAFAEAVDAAAKATPENVLVQTLAPVYRMFRMQPAITEAKRAMLRTAIAIRRGDADAVEASKDPFGDGPFDYAATTGGFRLRSAVTRKPGGEPVTLLVGTE